MDSTGGFLATVIERTRAYLDDASLDAKYDDNFLVRNIITPTFSSVASRINNSTTNAISTWIPFPLTKGLAYYQIPPCVGEVWRLAQRNDDDWVSREAMPRTEWHYRGPNWKVEGNMLVFAPTPDQDYVDLELQFMHNGDIQPFRLTSATLSAPSGSLDTLTFPLTTTPAVGTIDRRDNSYLGCVVRLLTSTGVIEERIISTWTKDSTNWKIVVRRPFTSNYSAGTVTNVEIAPFGLDSLYEAVAIGSAMKFSIYKKISGTQFQMLQLQYKDAMKTAMDHFSNKQMRTGKYFERSTADNPLNDWRNI
jgi:hypothetical protein